MKLVFKQPSVLPGFGLTLGYTVVYLSLIVLIPLSAVVLKTSQMSWSEFWAAVSDPRVVASYKLTFAASLIGALVNVVFGFAVAWSLVRYSFPGKRIFDVFINGAPVLARFDIHTCPDGVMLLTDALTPTEHLCERSDAVAAALGRVDCEHDA